MKSGQHVPVVDAKLSQTINCSWESDGWDGLLPTVT